MKTLFPLLFTIALFCHGYAQQGIIPDSVEYAALEKLYYATDGDTWYDRSGWLQDPNIANWYGVVVENGDVVKIDLSFNGLRGEIPERIYDLEQLRELWLEYNFLEGPLSNSLGRLVKLEILALRFNQFNGQLPSTIGDLVELQVLDLFTNNFDGELPASLWTLSKLRELIIPFNSFSGRIPWAISNLQNLEVFHIEDNLFEGVLPRSIGTLSNLRYLYIGYNLFSGELPRSMSNLVQLITIDFTGTPFEGTLPSFVNCPFLFNVYFAVSKISSLGDFYQHPELQDIGVYIDETSLDFEDLEPFFNPDGSEKPYFLFYAPQDSVNTYFNALDFTYSVETGGQFSQYQWLKNGVDIPGAVSNTLVLDSSVYDTSDAYQCRITNTLVTGLTLWSKAEAIPAGQFYAISTGNWHSSIWSREKNGPLTDELPGEKSEVFIIGKDVTLSQNTTSGPIRVIVENAGASLTVDGAEMMIVGDLELVKETEGYPGNVKVINGGRIVPVEK